MCPDSLNWTLWVRFHGRYWYQSFIDGSNIWGVDRTDPWGPEMDNPPLGRSYLVVESSCYMAMFIVTWEINSSAAAKYELYILLAADQRCSKKRVAALQADTFVYLSLSLYIYIYIYSSIYPYALRAYSINSLMILLAMKSILPCVITRGITWLIPSMFSMSQADYDRHISGLKA